MESTLKDQEKVSQLFYDLEDINFIKIISIILLAYLLIILLRKTLPFLANRGPSKTRLILLGSLPILKLIIVITALIWVVPKIIEINFQNFVVVFGAASVAIGFAFKDYVSSIIAGIVVIFEGTYRPGDYVTINDCYGEVVKVGLRAVKINTSDDDMVTIPHNTIWNKPINNANDGEQTLRCIAHFYLHPHHNPNEVAKLLIRIAQSSIYVTYDKSISIKVIEHPWGSHYELHAYPFDLRDKTAFVNDLQIRGKVALEELNIQCINIIPQAYLAQS